MKTGAPGKIEMVRSYYQDLIPLLPGMAPRVFREGA